MLLPDCKRVVLCSVFVVLFFAFTSTFAVAQEGMSREQVIDALKKGVVALKTIDRPEEAQRMANVLEQYLKPRKRRGSEHGRDHNLSEREIGIQHVKHMRMALEGLIAAEKKEAAISLEKAIHARELRLEGKQDEKSRKKIEDSPSRGQQVELLVYAAKMLKEQGKTEKAQVVSQLAEKFRRPTDSANAREREQRDRDARKEREREQDRAEKRRDAERAEMLELRKRIMIEIETHEKMMEKLKVQAEDVQAELRSRMERLSKNNEDLRAKLKKLEGRGK